MEGGNISNSASGSSGRNSRHSGNSGNELKVESANSDVKNKENFNGINKLEAKQLSRSMDMEEICPN